jgi:hypothetical protein
VRFPTSPVSIVAPRVLRCNGRTAARYPARVAKEKAEIVVRQPKSIREIAWNAQLRLCRRFRALSASGKRPTVVVAAIARELSGFVWAIGQ